MHFNNSEALTFGLELELQLVSPTSGRLSPSGLEVHKLLAAGPHAAKFALEATLATIEVNSSVHSDGAEMEGEVFHLVETARQAAQQTGCDVRGGGTQLTQFWNERVTAPSRRAQELERRFGFLPKRFSTYGMHVHVGMPSAEAAIRVANVMQSLCPLFIALSAASPFMQLADTGFAASRPLEPLVYPNGGPMPWLRDWAHLEQVTQELFATEIAHNLKDIYWDVRPKPEYGTVEIRVFDTPLSVDKAIALASFTRNLAALALRHQLELPSDTPNFATQQKVSRFLACRDGMQAELFNPMTQSWMGAIAWMEHLLGYIERFNPLPHDMQWLPALRTFANGEQDHARMRSAWSALYPPESEPQTLSTALAAYSVQMCDRLLSRTAV